MICGDCQGSGWILPPFSKEHICAPIAMRCQCRGGYEALASKIETNSINPDAGLARRIRATWKNISQYEYMHGLKRPSCKCKANEVPF